MYSVQVSEIARKKKIFSLSLRGWAEPQGVLQASGSGFSQGLQQWKMAANGQNEMG
jgi:hypothetical protein